MEVLSKFLGSSYEEKAEKICQGWLLHQDNARPHISKATMDFIAKHGINLLNHAPYSPDLAPCDFWLFPHLKTLLAGNTYVMEQGGQDSHGGVFEIAHEGWCFACHGEVEQEYGQVRESRWGLRGKMIYKKFFTISMQQKILRGNFWDFSTLKEHNSLINKSTKWYQICFKTTK